MALVSDVLPEGDTSPRSEIWFQTIQSYPYRAGLAVPQLLTSSIEHRFNGRLRSPSSFRRKGEPLTQEPSSQFFLAAPGIPSCATRRTLTTFRRSPGYTGNSVRI